MSRSICHKLGIIIDCIKRALDCTNKVTWFRRPAQLRPQNETTASIVFRHQRTPLTSSKIYSILMGPTIPNCKLNGPSSHNWQYYILYILQI